MFEIMNNQASYSLFKEGLARPVYSKALYLWCCLSVFFRPKGIMSDERERSDIQEGCWDGRILILVSVFCEETGESFHC